MTTSAMAPPTGDSGARIRLRAWRESDLAPLAELHADPAAMRHFVAPLTRTESDAFAARMQAHIAAHGWGFWPVEDIASARFVGVVGLLRISWHARFTPAVEIGWRIAPAHQRRGYAREAARMVLRFGFQQLRLPEIVAFTIPANVSSLRLMESLGMVADGSFDHPRLPEGHAMRPHLLYRLTAAAHAAGDGLFTPAPRSG